ncbi:hypothetical protein [Cellvibrio sp. NN19]|uniref:hypothetical protein n=1 Tax=Cellvibrio chitinivorans TaxID=3102792 RepID=UPI002B410BA0|nr:hypothetical protein [Cellvibrio sp. NN19]
MSGKINNFQQGFFARIIRDALTPLPDDSHARPAFELEESVQQMLSPVTDTHLNSSAQDSQHKLSANTSTPADNSRVAVNFSDPVAQPAMVNPSGTDAPHVVANNASTLVDKQARIATSATQPLTQSVTAPAPVLPTKVIQSASKKMPLRISTRSAPTFDQPVFHSQPVNQQQLNRPIFNKQHLTPAPDLTSARQPTTSEASTSQGERSAHESAQPQVSMAEPHCSKRLLSESVLAERLALEKPSAPQLRIGAVSIRVIDSAPAQAAAQRPSDVGKKAQISDAITSADSRQFLRTL